MTNKTIFEKLQEARCLLQSNLIKKSGKNNFVNFNYFELSDFLPTLNEILKSLKLSSIFFIEDNQAKLKIVDYENEKDLTFTVPFEKAKINGASEIQNLGGTLTYLRRYLYIIAFEICENDIIDNQPMQKKHNNENTEKKEREIETKKILNEYENLKKNKEIPEEKKLNIKKLDEKIKNGNFRLKNVENAIEFLKTLKDINNSKVIKFDDLLETNIPKKLFND
ncbi:MAG: hypothetical protein GYA62_08865 [Bacteroidales bacterium]|nr:hypothetical protein [Bacteroidales bacterium]